jgi:hypothetical protein
MSQNKQQTEKNILKILRIYAGFVEVELECSGKIG